MTDRAPIRLIRTDPVGETTGIGCNRGAGCKLTSFPRYRETPEGRALRALRLDVDVSLRDAACRMGITPEELSGLENGRYVPESPETWAALERRLRGTPP